MLQNITLLGRTINLYDFFNNFAFFAQVLVALYVRREFAEASTLPKLANLYLNKKKKDTLFWRWGFVVLLALGSNYIITTINNLSTKPISTFFLGVSDANFFPNIFIAPLTIFLLYTLLKNSPLKTLDLFAPTTATALICYKIACFFDGCCNGVACESFGMFNHKTDRVEFPIQLVEIACAVVMLVILMVLVRKKNRLPGLLYPLFMLMYCGSRFISEFWRDDYPAVWGILKAYHIQCIIGFVEGAIFLIVVLIWGRRITAYFEAKNQALLDRHAEKLRSRSYNRKKR